MGRIGRKGFPRAGRGTHTSGPVESFAKRFPVADEAIKRHVRGFSEPLFARPKGFPAIEVVPTVFFSIDFSGSMSNPNDVLIDPTPAEVLVDRLVELATLLAPTEYQLIRLDLLDEGAFSGEEWLYPPGRPFAENLAFSDTFRNFWGGDILWLIFSNGAEVTYYPDQSPYAGPFDRYWNDYAAISPTSATATVPGNTRSNYRTLKVIIYNCPRFGVLGGPPFTWSDRYRTHLEQSIQGSGFHSGFPLVDFELGGDIDHRQDASVYQSTITSYFQTVPELGPSD